MPVKVPFLRPLRRLTETFHAFESLSRAQLRTVGLTIPQFDIIAALGNTPGMSFRELGEASLITKGTLTGVVDRMVRDGIVERHSAPGDGRMMIVRLTAHGEALFESVFPAVVANTSRAFEGVSAKDLKTLEALLTRLRDAFTDCARTEAGLDVPHASQVRDSRATKSSTGRSGGSAPAVIPFKGSRR